MAQARCSLAGGAPWRCRRPRGGGVGGGGLRLVTGDARPRRTGPAAETQDVESLTAAATAAGSRWELGRRVRPVMRGCGGAPGAGPAGESAGGGRRGPGRWRRGLAAAPWPGPGGGTPPTRPSRARKSGAPGDPVVEGPREGAAAEGREV